MNFTSVNTFDASADSIPAPIGPDLDRQRVGRALLLVGASAAVAFVLLVVIGAAITDGYSHSSQAISELAAAGAEHAALQTIAFVVVGIGVCSYAAGLRVVGGAPILVVALTATFGVLSAFANAALPCDQGCEPTTATGTAHIVTGSIGFLAVLVAMFALARHWRRSEPHAALARPTRALALGGLVGLIAFNATKAADFDRIDGLAQRAFVLCVLAWIVMTALALWRIGRSG